ncbi:MAG: hypothetical protein GX237_03545 [Clostridiales bacterium]|nr:hypothetical protein [Clostridiales bacterium]
MKKKVLYMVVLLSFFALAGCSKDNISLNTNDINTNTMLVKRDGTIYTAIIEEFTENYYSLSELNEFTSSEVNKYNEKVGSNEVTIEDLELRNGKAVLTLKYSKMEHYSAFQNMPAAYYNASLQDVPLELPEQYVDAKKNTVVGKDTAMENGKNKVLVLYEPYEILVEGNIKYYSNNATLIEDNKVGSYNDEMVVVVFKP